MPPETNKTRYLLAPIAGQIQLQSFIVVIPGSQLGLAIAQGGCSMSGSKVSSEMHTCCVEACLT